jgi:hypothetical protein
MNTIPRYTSSFPLQKQFITNADSSGDNIFTQLKRTNNVCLYSRVNPEHKNTIYEVIITNTVPKGTVFAKGATPTENDYESYPGGKSWGTKGWTYYGSKNAETKFNLVVKEQSAKKVKRENKANGIEEPSELTESHDIPKGEFTRVEFATMNCLPPVGVVSQILKILLDKGIIKESRREQRGRGQPTILFVKA